MKDTDYVYAVGRIRVKEISLLSSSEIGRLVSAKTISEAVGILNSKGYEFEGNDYEKAISRQRTQTWRLMREILPDISCMNSLIIKNDYHNLKAGVKAAVTGIDAKAFLLSPSVYIPDEIYSAVFQKKFSLLPDEMADAARKSYDILVRTKSAQLSDAVIDKASMESMLRYSKNGESKIFSSIAQWTVACTDIKILFRCIEAGKSAEFMRYAVCSCDMFSAGEIINAAEGGMDKFYEFLEKTGFGKGAEALKESPAAFEKFCDDGLMKIINDARMTAFGIDPIAAYFIAKETELLNVRIIMSGKLNDIPESVINARVRELYV